jgi:hypothetical protein
MPSKGILFLLPFLLEIFMISTILNVEKLDQNSLDG